MALARRTSQRVTLLMLVLASLTVLTLDYHGEASRAIGHVRHGVAEALSPIQRGIAAALHPIGDLVSGSIHYGALETQNERLRAELGQLHQQLAANDLAAATERQLISSSGLPFVGNTPTVPAEVYSGATSNFSPTIEINRGTSSGVGDGMPVVADQGLIGMVTSASSSTATVRLITASGQIVGVHNAAGNAYRAVGTGTGKALSLSTLPGTSGGGKRGDTLETSAQGAYPAGIPVAIVSTMHNSVGGQSEAVSAAPLANLSDLQFVSVLEWLPAA